MLAADINGETRSATRIVNVGYHALTANMSIDGNLDKTKKNHAITIDTKNLNGAFVAAKGTIKIHKLKAPNAVIRPRPWAAPDYQDIHEADFKKLFPHDAYNAQQHSNNWKKGKLEFVSKSEYQNGDTAHITLGSAAKNISVTVVVEKVKLFLCLIQKPI